MRDFHDRLQDILDAIGQIEVEQLKGRAAFDGSSLIQVWMVHHLMIAYYLQHASAVEDYLAEQAQAVQEVRREVENGLATNALRERLSQRRAQAAV